MSTAVAVADTAALIPASLYARLKHETNLAAARQELSGLRFSIILLSRWESSKSIDEPNRCELRFELAHLRALYSEKIDDIAMIFGVPEAIEAKEQVERAIKVPQGMMPPMKLRQDMQLY